VVVTDPDGNANEIQLRKVRQQRVAPRDDFWGAFDRSAESGGGEGRRGRRGGGGGESGGGMFNWLFR
jgi:hypothetical protein